MRRPERHDEHIAGKDFDSPRVRFTKFLDANAVPYIDLVPPMLAHYKTSTEFLHFVKDSHLTTQGHRVVARAVEAWLRARCSAYELPLRECIAPAL